MGRKKFIPTVGKIYENKGGGTYLCMEILDDFVIDNIVLMKNTKSNWVLKAHCCGIYPDGKIDWDFSSGGHFE